MRAIVWIFRAFVFFALFAFSLNNRQAATVNWFFGVQWHAPLVIIVLVSFAIGAVVGVFAMVPSWWRHRRVARGRHGMDGAAAGQTGAAKVGSPLNAVPVAPADTYPLRDGI